MISEFNSRLKAIEKVASIENDEDFLLRRLLAFKDYCEVPSGLAKREALEAWHKVDPEESARKITEALEARIVQAKARSSENAKTASLAGWKS
jgi:hypothetical protein